MASGRAPGGAIDGGVSSTCELDSSVHFPSICGLRGKNTLGGVVGSDIGSEVSEDDGDRGGRDIDDDELDSPDTAWLNL